MRLLRTIIVFISFVLISFKSYAITESQIINAINSGESNPFTKLIKNEFASELDEFEIYTKDGSLVFAGSESYSYNVGCQDRKYLDLDFKVKLDSGADVFKTSIDRFSQDIQIKGVTEVTIYLDGTAEFKEKYDGLFGCETAFSISSDIEADADAVLYIDLKAGFKGEQIDSNTVIITPYSDLTYYGNLQSQADVGVDIPSQYLVGLGATVGGILSLLNPVVGIVATVAIIFGGEDELEDLIEDELDDLIADYQNEINSLSGKTGYKEHTPIQIDVPSSNFLTDDQYRKLMRAEGYGGYNCGNGKANQTEVLLGLLSNSISGHEAFVVPERQCRDAVGVAITSLLL